MKRRLIFSLMVLVLIFSVQGCFLLDQSTMDTPKPAPMTLDVGSRINGKTIVWVNTKGDSWRFLAIGAPSKPIQWANDASRFLNDKNMAADMGKGKANTLYLTGEFSSHAHTVSNNAAHYCRSVGGWLPSRDEAEKIIPFANKNFWTSTAEKTSKAFYYDITTRSFKTEFRNERDKIVTIPVYYLDSNGNEVNP
ncbi:hypothetical protein E4O03_02430 [Treponema sp. OMZ 792]|uniref:hypothetical protein n=1 Tax=unclassified Treponema TaxID=2638727 RepID=UPI0020A4218E|nr:MULTISPECIES: hypothetical protein [unclassified Treponema]UTC75605.1 hypothetical protein E4O03_02430 [Treponema sp. OMZ 792]UTC78595.1 hypothetical protein E4O04_11545 [Treponema sp. OMZ 799]UTC79606.1 hypothetical protein E4O07_02440 [Treponema sp. OMZ 798]